MILKEKFINLLKKKALQDTSLIYLGSLLNGVSLLLVNIFLGRVLEKDLFGIFSLCIMVLTTVAEMSDFGLNGGLLRFAPYYLANKELGKVKQLVKTIWRWRVWMSFILTLVGILTAPWIAKYVLNNLQVVLYLAFSFLGIGGVVLVGFASAYLQASKNFLMNSLVQSLKGILRLLFILLIFILGVNSLAWYIFIYIAIPWVLFLLTYKYLPKGFRSAQVEVEVKQKINTQLSKFSFWLTISSLSAILSSRVDQVMLSHLMGLNQVATYAMAFQFVYIFSLAIQSITGVLVPKVNSLQTSQDLYLFFIRVLKWMFPIALSAVFLVFISQYVIYFIFGQKYLASVPVYMFLSYSIILGFFSIPPSLVVIAFNKTSLIAVSAFLQLVINFILNLWLIPKFGIMGAAYTFSIGIATSLVYNVVCATYLFKKGSLTVG